MLYLKNTLHGLSRSIAGSAMQTFQGPHRWWKLALYAVLFVLPGGSLGVMVFAWIDHRRQARAARVVPAARLTSNAGAGASAANQPGAASAGGCQSRADAAPCRAAAGKHKQPRQACSKPLN
ncbi:hypothetical protein [Paraburkholderia sp.]|uniref:hypothetical protein n=1 Tax=Paraburkholderia sp. TaxID=1926495 RepID=UPI00239E0141|nr:hypothetical protein [Paraburkholderia sp.]MDE1181355.1 hypothetical protein [Paraburkholderia sp.]